MGGYILKWVSRRRNLHKVQIGLCGLSKVVAICLNLLLLLRSVKLHNRALILVKVPTTTRIIMDPWLACAAQGQTHKQMTSFSWIIIPTGVENYLTSSSWKKNWKCHLFTCLKHSWYVNACCLNNEFWRCSSSAEPTQRCRENAFFPSHYKTHSSSGRRFEELFSANNMQRGPFFSLGQFHFQD